MRNYSQVCDEFVFVSYNINDEYFRTADDVYRSVYEALIETMEITHNQMALACAAISSQGRLAFADDYEAAQSVTPSESRVIANLWIFYCDVIAAENRTPCLGDDRMFYYANVTTGKTVAWVRVVG
jgi:hypothetical protein